MTESRNQWRTKQIQEKQKFEKNIMQLRISMKSYQKSLVEEKQLKIKFDCERTAYET